MQYITVKELLNEIDEHLKTLLILSNFLKGNHFNRLLKSNFRFNIKSINPIIEKQLIDIKSNRLNHAFNYEIKKTKYPTTPYKDIPLRELLDACVSQLNEYCEEIFNTLGCIKPTKKDTHFTTPKGVSVIDHFQTVLGSKRLDNDRYYFAKISHKFGLKDTFIIQEILYGLETFIDMIDTFANETKFIEYEKSLAKLMKKNDFFTNGYPLDILVHDKNILKNKHTCKQKLIAIYSHPDYASYTAVYENTPNYLLENKTLKIA
jgi:hypothetical protein